MAKFSKITLKSMEMLFKVGGVNIYALSLKKGKIKVAIENTNLVNDLPTLEFVNNIELMFKDLKLKKLTVYVGDGKFDMVKIKNNKITILSNDTMEALVYAKGKPYDIVVVKGGWYGDKQTFKMEDLNTDKTIT